SSASGTHFPRARASGCARGPIAYTCSTRRAANGSKGRATSMERASNQKREDQMTERKITRRDAIKAGAALAGAAALQAANLTLFAQAWAQSSPWKPEKGAKLQLLRWKRFVQSEEDGFMALVAAFTKATGVPVSVLNESLDDVQPKAS